MKGNSKRKSRKGLVAGAFIIAFIIALGVFFVINLISTEKEFTIYSALEEARFPVLHAVVNGKEVNAMHAYIEDMGNEAAMDCITPLPEDRMLEIRVDRFGSLVTELNYEVRSLDLSHFIEKNTGRIITENNERTIVRLPIENMIKKDQQYLLTIHLDTGEEKLNYYTRILWPSDEKCSEMTDLALEFHTKSFDYNEARDLTGYLEISDEADNTDLSRVTIHSNFSQLTWGSTGMKRTGKPEVLIREYKGLSSTVEISYLSEMTTDSGETEYFTSKEIYTMRTGAERIYLMNFERRTNQIFDGRKQLFSGKRINLGIATESALEGKKSDSGRYVVFEANKDLWVYDQSSHKAIDIFSFRSGINTDIRQNYDRHDVKILSVSDSGIIEFAVYGYMNRGRHEGYNGIGYYSFSMEDETLNEIFFIPIHRCYDKIAKEVNELCVKGGSNMLFIKQNDAVVAVNLHSLELVTVASALNDSCYAVNEEQTAVAWLKDGKFDSSSIRLLDLVSGTTKDIEAGNGEKLRTIDFVGGDLVYGCARTEDKWILHGHVKSLPMYSLKIIDRYGTVKKEYSKKNCHIDKVSVEKNRIHLSLYRKTENSYSYYDTDTIVGSTVDEESGLLRRADSKNKKKINYVAIDEEIKNTRLIKESIPGNISYENAGTVELKNDTFAEGIQFYAYASGGLKGSSFTFSKAMELCYKDYGYIEDGNGTVIYNRCDRDIRASVNEPKPAAEPITENLLTMEDSIEVDDKLLINAQETDYDSLLYYVYQGMPFAIRSSRSSCILIYAYDRKTVTLLYSSGGKGEERSEKMNRDEAEKLFASLGNDFICLYAYER